MSWANASNIVSGDTNLNTYFDALTGFNSSDEDKEMFEGVSSGYYDILAQYNYMLQTQGIIKATAWLKDKYGFKDINQLTEATQNAMVLREMDKKKATEAQQKYAKEQREARESGIVNREAAAKQAQTQARSQGMSKGLAASIGNAPLSGQASANYSGNLSALQNLGQSTQNDYLQKMGYANALEQQASNMEKGSALNIVGAAVGGAGAGAGLGASLFGGMGKGD